MDAAQALADLTEISSQIEGAVITDPGGAVLASTFSDDGRAGRVAGLARDLLASAEEVRGDLGREELVQLEAATPEGSVFVVRDGERVVVAVTRARPTVGLVFYDLKTCLRLVGQSEAPAAARVDEDA